MTMKRIPSAIMVRFLTVFQFRVLIGNVAVALTLSKVKKGIFLIKKY